MRAPAAERVLSAPPPGALPRVLTGLHADGTAVGIEEHLHRWGLVPLQRAGSHLIDELEASGLAGHGGAWFPVATKWRSIRGGPLRRPVVVANGAEGEPASGKDQLLLSQLPHLVLDGASLAAAALDASRVVVYAPEHCSRIVLSAARARRRLRLDPVEIEVITAPDAFIAGQETAVVNALNRGVAVPTFAEKAPIRRKGVGGRPTLVQNVETLAHVALVARFGPGWFRGPEAPGSAGTMLLTVTGRWPRPCVIEAPVGAPLAEVLDLSAAAAAGYHGALLGGYGGGWIPMRAALDLRLSEDAARRLGTSLGAGVVVLLPRTACPLAESARVVRYLERQGAGQCGPCVNGLAELAGLSAMLATTPAALAGRVDLLLDACDLVERRGACRHPDGATRFVRSALDVFGDEVSAHLRSGPCRLVDAPTVLPGLRQISLLPAARGARSAKR